MLTKLALFAAYAASLLALIALVFWVSRQAGALDLCEQYGSASEYNFACLGQILKVDAWALCAAAGAGAAFFLLQRLVSKWLDRSADAFRHQLANTAQQLSTMNDRLPPTVFLKPIGDEAALALTWGSAMAALMQGLSVSLFCLLQSVRDVWMRVPPMARGVGGLVFTVLWSGGTAGVADWVMQWVTSGNADWRGLNLFSIVEFSGPWEDLSVQLFIAVSAALAEFSWAVMLLNGCVLLVILVIAFLAAAGVGAASLKAALYFRITIEAIPTGSHQLDLVDTSTPLTPGSTRVAIGGLSHSALYNSPGAIDAVRKALAGFEGARQARLGQRQN
jgi:hypothetical protein